MDNSGNWAVITESATLSAPVWLDYPLSVCCQAIAISMHSDNSQDEWLHYQRVLEFLASLSYRSLELDRYLAQITQGVSGLLKLDWTVVTLCQDGTERVLASSLDMGAGEHVYALHGTLTGTVIELGRSLAVEDTTTCTDFGAAPEGYCSYLGVPLRTQNGVVIGTICSFNRAPRHFSEAEVQTTELFAERAATAIDNYYLYQQQLQFNERLEAEVAARTAELQLAQAKLVEQERLAAIGEFAAMIVHEIRNPLTTVMMGLKSFQRLELPATAQERLSLATDEADRLERLLGEILLYAKPQILQLTELDLYGLMQSVIAALTAQQPTWRSRIQLDPAPSPCVIKGDRDKLKQVLLNVIRNACEAIAPTEIVTCCIDTTSTKQITIQIHNGGEPIPPDVLANLTKPFYSTKVGGTGLGLAIVKRIVAAHRGQFETISSKESGTLVLIHLPY